MAGNTKKHDWDKYKQEFVNSKHVGVAGRARERFGIKLGRNIPGWIRVNTKGWAEEKKEMAQASQKEAQEAIKQEETEKRKDTLRRASKVERAIIEEIMDDVEDKLGVKDQDGDYKLTPNDKEFAIRHLRTAQGKASDYFGSELDDTSPLQSRLKELGLLDDKK